MAPPAGPKRGEGAALSAKGEMDMECKKLRAGLQGLACYRDLRFGPPLAEASGLLDALCAGRGEEALAHYTGFFYALRAAGYAGPGSWLWDALRFEQAPYPSALDAGKADRELEAAARRDVEILITLAELDCGEIVREMEKLLPEEYRPVLLTLPRWSPGAPFDFETLRDSYLQNGAGLFARYRAFIWEDGALLPVPDPDCGQPILGFESQREQVLRNTRALVEGRLVNNVLLYGESGTGKSLTVKSLLAVPEFWNLRLIEVDKDRLSDLPCLIRLLTGRRQKFILFIDDLTFDKDDRTYSALKSILEGGLEKRPANVAVYATSNRRHLVRQTFSDRAGDEVDLSETIQEKTSLAERFGVRIPYLSMTRAEYLDMVEKLAAIFGITMEREQLRAEASRWELRHPGRTPRTARQFITSLTV